MTEEIRGKQGRGNYSWGSRTSKDFLDPSFVHRATVARPLIHLCILLAVELWDERVESAPKPPEPEKVALPGASQDLLRYHQLMESGSHFARMCQSASGELNISGFLH